MTKAATLTMLALCEAVKSRYRAWVASVDQSWFVSSDEMMRNYKSIIADLVGEYTTGQLIDSIDGIEKFLVNGHNEQLTVEAAVKQAVVDKLRIAAIDVTLENIVALRTGRLRGRMIELLASAEYALAGQVPPLLYMQMVVDLKKQLIDGRIEPSCSQLMGRFSHAKDMLGRYSDRTTLKEGDRIVYVKDAFQEVLAFYDGDRRRFETMLTEEMDIPPIAA